MPAVGKSRSRKARRWFRRDNRRALAICLLFATVASIGLGSVIQQHAPSIGNLRIAGHGPGFTQGDDELATGSVIFVPVLGNNCRKKLIDNATWRIRDSGPVDCRAALARGANANESGWSTSRVDIIRNGFYNR
jgi:hypothetical protein